MADITITITDGTTTPNVITIPDAKVHVTAQALAWKAGDSTPNANDVRAIRSALAALIKADRVEYRTARAFADFQAGYSASLATINSDETP